MPDAGVQRIITLEESSIGTAFYITAPGEYILVESIAFEVTWEPPLLVQAQVLYGAPTVGTLGYYSTPWIVMDPALVAAIGYFTFARGLTSVPDDAPRIVSPYALPEALEENTYFMVPLPNLPLGDGQSFTVVVSGADTAGAGVDLHIQNGLAVVTVLEGSDETDIVPPYTALSFAGQAAAA